MQIAGQEQFAALRHHWIREGDAFLLVFSVNFLCVYYARNYII